MTSTAEARLTNRVVIRPPHDTLVAAFEAAARDDAPFVTIHGARGAQHKTAREALDAALRWTALLRARGVARGDRVPILLPTGHAFVEALLGTMLAGAVPVPLAIPMTFGSVERYVKNLAAIVADAGARVLVAYPRVRDAIAREEALASLRDVLTEADLDGVAPSEAPLPSIGEHETAFLQYTSGTTGRPKGAIISHRAIVANAYAIAHGLGIGERDVGVSWLPLFHDMGLIGVLLTSICHPYPVHVISPESFVMRPRRWLELITSVGGTLSPAPNFAYDMCASRVEPEDLRLETWRAALDGAEPVHAATVDRFAQRFAPAGFDPAALMPVYGLAEATLAVAFPTLESRFETMALDRAALERGIATRVTSEGAFRAVSVGAPVAGTTIEIRGDDGRIARQGVVGEIVVSSASLMDGYFSDEPGSTKAISGGALRTGDLGFIDGGRLFVTGRAKELIIKGGRNVYPYDVERVAAEVQGVRAAAAFGRPNEATGTDDLVVVAETVHGEADRRALIAREIRGLLLEVIGVKADSIMVCAIGAVPRTTSGKVRRGECARKFTSSEGAI